MKTEELSVCLVQALKSAGKTVATAESCTGGGIGHALTAVSGSSAVYAGGVISYTNAIKERVLNVPSETLEKCGAVSSETAGHMAKGVQKLMMSDFGVSVTGIAGPDGDGSGKPVGLVYIGIASFDGVETYEFIFHGDRSAVREQAVRSALELILSKL